MVLEEDMFEAEEMFLKFDGEAWIEKSEGARVVAGVAAAVLVLGRFGVLSEEGAGYKL